jgi:hypothetical protein
MVDRDFIGRQHQNGFLELSTGNPCGLLAMNKLINQSVWVDI